MQEPVPRGVNGTGGEAFAVKVLEVANTPALVITALYAAAGELGVASMFSACSWSWLLAGVFIVAASIQSSSVGIVIRFGLGRFRRGAQEHGAA